MNSWASLLVVYLIGLLIGYVVGRIGFWRFQLRRRRRRKPRDDGFVSIGENVVIPPGGSVRINLGELHLGQSTPDDIKVSLRQLGKKDDRE